MNRVGLQKVGSLLALTAGAAIAGDVTACGGDEPTTEGGGISTEVCKSYARDEGAEIRAFAVQQKLDIPSLTTYARYRDQLLGLVRERVVPCLATGRPNVIFFPEETSMPASFVGTRGERSREQTKTVPAFVGMLSSYTEVAAYYDAKFPGLGLGEKASLVVTDTVWRAFYEVMRDIATETGAWVVTSANISGAVERSTDPAEVSALRDPDLEGVDAVYVARDRAVYNIAYVFAPDGQVVGTTKKAYLVPAEEKDLQLAFGPTRELMPIDVGWAKLGLFTSKDAWMPDVVDRLAIRGADFFVQPEAFSGWTIEQHPGDWLPDVLQQSGWAATQKHSAYRVGVIPHLTGNLFDNAIDGQSAFLVDALPGDARAGYVGHPAQPGFLSVAPWVSGSADRGELRAVGEALRIGGARANEYVETVLGADLSPHAPFPSPAGGAPGALGPSRVLADAPTGAQDRPAIAADGAGKIAIAWEDTRDGSSRVYVATSVDGGATFGAPVPVADGASGQHAPALVMAGPDLYVAWQELGASSSAIKIARRDGAAFTPLGAAQGATDAWLPALASHGQTDVCMAFVAADSLGSERVRVTCTNDRGQTWGEAPADAAPLPGPKYVSRNNQWSPGIAMTPDAVVVAWVDFRNDNWDVFSSRSTDGGGTFSVATRIDDATDQRERIHDDVVLTAIDGGGVLAAWSDVRLRKPRATARIGALGGPSFSLSPDADYQVAWRPRMTELAPGTVVAVWQDGRSLGNDIYLSKSSDGGASFGAAARIDDGGDAASYQLSPQVASAGGGRALVAWVDTRGGRPQIRFVVGTP